MTILSKYKLIFIILGIAVVVEIIWAVKTLRGNVPVPIVASTQSAPKFNFQPASITLSAPKTTFKVGEKIPVSINLNSIKATDGTDVILNFNSNLLVASKSAEVGTIYDDYPLNNTDNVLGKVSISGISSAAAGKVAKGVFGTIIFTATAPGKAQVNIDFTKGSTIDSNVTETKTAKDLLGKVENLEVEIK